MDVRYVFLNLLRYRLIQDCFGIAYTGATFNPIPKGRPRAKGVDSLAYSVGLNMLVRTKSTNRQEFRAESLGDFRYEF